MQFNFVAPCVALGKAIGGTFTGTKLWRMSKRHATWPTLVNGFMVYVQWKVRGWRQEIWENLPSAYWHGRLVSPLLVWKNARNNQPSYLWHQRRWSPVIGSTVLWRRLQPWTSHSLKPNVLCGDNILSSLRRNQRQVKRGRDVAQAGPFAPTTMVLNAVATCWNAR